MNMQESNPKTPELLRTDSGSTPTSLSLYLYLIILVLSFYLTFSFKIYVQGEYYGAKAISVKHGQGCSGCRKSRTPENIDGLGDWGRQKSYLG